MTHSSKNMLIQAYNFIINRRAHVVCLTPILLNTELAHIHHVLTGVNEYPRWALDWIFQQVEDEQTTPENKLSDTLDNTDESEVYKTMLILPYGGKQGEQILRVSKKDLSKVLTDKLLTPLFTQTRNSVQISNLKM